MVESESFTDLRIKVNTNDKMLTNIFAFVYIHGYEIQQKSISKVSYSWQREIVFHKFL